MTSYGREAIQNKIFVQELNISFLFGIRLQKSNKKTVTGQVFPVLMQQFGTVFCVLIDLDGHDGNCALCQLNEY